ncbi:SapC family protein [Sphingomonas azotifigens]|uniref:SapC family protein n=1 Tax=Sphingomonas azotifigens TaxID=330920 RepID=UPI00143175BC|nr:SapC family protein [Sphingomonas azotifigens]
MTSATKTKKQHAEVQGAQVNGAMPLYVVPQAVHSVTHREVSVRTGEGTFAFAEKTPIIEVTVDEFERAALDFPIVFVGESLQPFAVMGLEADRNQFVSAGSYRPGAYVPAYLRRYPFVFARDEGSEALILCLDHASERVGKAGDAEAMPLFDGEEPTALTRQAIQFCENYEAARARTSVLIGLLRELDLLEARQATREGADGEGATLLLEYQTIDAAKLDALDADAFQRLRSAGALPAIYAQLASQANWQVLAVTRPTA